MKIKDDITINYVINALGKAHHEGKLILFFGAGISMFFGLPNWAGFVEKYIDLYLKTYEEKVLQQTAILKFVDNYDLVCDKLNNLKDIKIKLAASRNKGISINRLDIVTENIEKNMIFLNNINNNDQEKNDLKKEILSILNKDNKNESQDNLFKNIINIATKNIVITTNVDNLFNNNKYEDKLNYIDYDTLINLNNKKSNKNLFWKIIDDSKSRIISIHGHLHNNHLTPTKYPSSVIDTRQKLVELYKIKKFGNAFKNIIKTLLNKEYKILFVGYSFQDFHISNILTALITEEPLLINDLFSIEFDDKRNEFDNPSIISKENSVSYYELTGRKNMKDENKLKALNLVFKKIMKQAKQWKNLKDIKWIDFVFEKQSTFPINKKNLNISKDTETEIINWLNDSNNDYHNNQKNKNKIFLFLLDYVNKKIIKKQTTRNFIKLITFILKEIINNKFENNIYEYLFTSDFLSTIIIENKSSNNFDDIKWTKLIFIVCSKNIEKNNNQTPVLNQHSVFIMQNLIIKLSESKTANHKTKLKKILNNNFVIFLKKMTTPYFGNDNSSGRRYQNLIIISYLAIWKQFKKDKNWTNLFSKYLIIISMLKVEYIDDGCKNNIAINEFVISILNEKYWNKQKCNHYNKDVFNFWNKYYYEINMMDYYCCCDDMLYKNYHPLIKIDEKNESKKQISKTLNDLWNKVIKPEIRLNFWKLSLKNIIEIITKHDFHVENKEWFYFKEFHNNFINILLYKTINNLIKKQEISFVKREIKKLIKLRSYRFRHCYQFITLNILLNNYLTENSNTIDLIKCFFQEIHSISNVMTTKQNINNMEQFLNEYPNIYNKNKMDNIYNIIIEINKNNDMTFELEKSQITNKYDIKMSTDYHYNQVSKIEGKYEIIKTNETEFLLKTPEEKVKHLSWFLKLTKEYQGNLNVWYFIEVIKVDKDRKYIENGLNKLKLDNDDLKFVKSWIKYKGDRINLKTMKMSNDLKINSICDFVKEVIKIPERAFFVIWISMDKGFLKNLILSVKDDKFYLDLRKIMTEHSFKKYLFITKEYKALKIDNISKAFFNDFILINGFNNGLELFRKKEIDIDYLLSFFHFCNYKLFIDFKPFKKEKFNLNFEDPKDKEIYYQIFTKLFDVHNRQDDINSFIFSLDIITILENNFKLKYSETTFIDDISNKTKNKYMSSKFFDTDKMIVEKSNSIKRLAEKIKFVASLLKNKLDNSSNVVVSDILQRVYKLNNSKPVYIFTFLKSVFWASNNSDFDKEKIRKILICINDKILVNIDGSTKYGNDDPERPFNKIQINHYNDGLRILKPVKKLINAIILKKKITLENLDIKGENFIATALFNIAIRIGLIT